MKSFLYFFGLWCLLSVLPSLGFVQQVLGQTSSECYILTRTYTQPSGASYIEDISYLDGFGREKQKVERGAMPGGGGDIITPVRYGIFGRTERIYLPYNRPSNNGAYDPNGFNTGNWSVYGTSDQAYAFTHTDYDNSPLDRIVKQTGPGALWQQSGKGVTTEYFFNPANEVILWRLSSQGQPVKDGYYVANTLEGVRTTNEDGQIAETYDDGRGHTLVSIAVNGSERLRTYYIYDVYDRLRYVLPPEASASSSLTQTILDRYCYVYRYDRWGRLIEKKLPGCEPLLMVYDNKDRMVLSQDGNQRTSNTWSYSLYDSKNRVIETGEISLGNKSHAQLQEEAGNSGNYIPSGTRTALQYSLYDSYTPTSIIVPHAFVASTGYAASYHPLVTGLLTATKTRILGTDSWQTTTLYYDDRVRVIQTVSDNRLGGISRCDMKYDFVDHLIQQRESHGKSSGQADVLESVNSYDNRGRLLSQSIRLNGGTAATVTCQYDAVGRLTGYKYVNLSETLSYNIRGWLTAKTSTPFRISLRYESPQGGSAARYNGNISEWEWQQGTNAALMYGFTYDDLSRFTGAVEKQKSGNTWSTLSGHYTEQGLSYDRNGNLLGLQRTAGGVVVDHLAYSYTGNQLTGLTENVRTSPTNDIYAPGNAAVGSYSYDANGNLLNDSRRALNFDYNVLDLLSEVRSGSTVKATYTWLADGTKLGVRDGSGSNGFEYLGSLIYRKSGSGFKLSEALFSDGVIRLYDNGTQEVNYFLTDHLGSVRVIVDASGVVKERNDYYPFGARHVRSDYAQSTNRWKYNGKEEQTTGDLDYLDYGARMYDAGLGRWMTVDPMAEKSYIQSSYIYCGNSPCVYTDPDGMMRVYYNADGTYSHTTRNNWFHNFFFGIQNYIQNDAQGWTNVSEAEFREWVNDVGVWHDQEALNAWARDFVANYEFKQNLERLGIEYRVTTSRLEALASHLQWALPNVLKSASIATTKAAPAVRYFDSFAAFKKAMGPAGEGYAWHHIVEQNSANIAKFGARVIHNTKNIVRVPAGKGSIHAKISGHYSSKFKFTEGKTVRQWLNSKSYKEQYDYGRKLLKKYGI